MIFKFYNSPFRLKMCYCNCHDKLAGKAWGGWKYALCLIPSMLTCGLVPLLYGIACCPCICIESVCKIDAQELEHCSEEEKWRLMKKNSVIHSGQMKLSSFFVPHSMPKEAYMVYSGRSIEN